MPVKTYFQAKLIFKKRKMIHQILKGIFLLLLFSACGNSTYNSNEIDAQENQETLKEGIVMPLTGGRWESNAETSQGISNMQDLLKDFSGQQTLESYDLLQNQLETEFAGILKNCTMKGEAHDRLHDYLMPIKTYFNDLQSNDTSKAKNAYDNLVDHLAHYTAYFE